MQPARRHAAACGSEPFPRCNRRHGRPADGQGERPREGPSPKHSHSRMGPLRQRHRIHEGGRRKSCCSINTRGPPPGSPPTLRQEPIGLAVDKSVERPSGGGLDGTATAAAQRTAVPKVKLGYNAVRTKQLSATRCANRSPSRSRTPCPKSTPRGSVLLPSRTDPESRRLVPGRWPWACSRLARTYK